MRPNDAALTDELRQLAAEWPLCYQFDLNPGDHVVVAGAYKGRVMDLLLRLYPGIVVDGFEPAAWARNEAQARLEAAGHDPAYWFLRPFGIGTRTAEHQPMGEWGTDACSFVNTGPGARERGFGDLLDWRECLDGAIPALFVYNMEGYEFQLVYDMLLDGRFGRSAFAIQWHTPYGRREFTPNIFVEFDRTHRLEWNTWPQWTYHVPR